MKKISVNLRLDDKVFDKINQIIEYENISIEILLTNIIEKYIKKCTKENKVILSSIFDGLWSIDGSKKGYFFEGNIWTEIGEKGNNRTKGVFTYNDKTIILTITHKYNSSSNEWWDESEFGIKEKIKYKLDNNFLFLKKDGKDEQKYKKME